MEIGGDGLSTIRRQGVVFRDTLGGSLETTTPMSHQPKMSSFRPRTHTMDGAIRQGLAPAPESRNRVGSFSSAVSLSTSEDSRGPLSQPQFESLVHPPSHPRPMDLHTPPVAMSKEKKTSSRSRLVKRISSRPTSPPLSPPPSVDSLPVPIPTKDANKVLLLMKTLCGRMKGEIEYQSESTGPWHCGVCYIDEDKGCLMFDSGDMGPFHTPIIPDLRGCRVVPVDRIDKATQCLEVTNYHGIEILLRPLMVEEYDLWLAALLCWQQLQPAGGRQLNRRAADNSSSARAEMKRRASSTGLKDTGTTIIKVGKVMLWDKGLATSPRAIVKRSSTRDLRSSSQTAWRRVSCMLQDNGAFKLMTENDVAVLSVIELSQLARYAIQQVDKSVLEEDFSIGIFPIYAPSSTHLSIFRPIYIALDSRVLFEVWFVLLRAFTVPIIYGLQLSEGKTTKEVCEISDFSVQPAADHFRIENTIQVRITEAKLRSSNLAPDGGSRDRHVKVQDGLVGNYLAEVILDGEVRGRTTTQTSTRNPFWRDECIFANLPSTLPFLSVLLKRVDGNMAVVNHQLQPSVGLPRSGDLIEVLCGCVDIPLHQLERGKDHEQWLPIYDERHQSIGTMLIKIHHEELIVLTEQEYAPVAELLHAFSKGLTAQISEALQGHQQGNLRRLAEIFLNIFQVSGKATEWLMVLVEDEIDGIGNQTSKKKQPRFSRRLQSNESIESTSDREHFVRDMGKSLAGEANLLFRGNSLLTQALECQMRRLGKEYLEEALADKIFEINEANADCEVDPSKLRHGDQIDQHWTRLIRLTTEVWECIASPANPIPSELRQVLKYVRAVAEDRYGDFLRTVTYTSVSGFLFLRFICPAILNPKLFGLLRDRPRPRAQRTLTLIAKGLQALANLNTIGKKETWTEPMNRFINSHRQSLKEFIDQVCSIPMERTGSLSITVPASYSTPITILGRLAPLSREGFPSLPYLIDDARSFAMLVKLWTDANGPPASSDGTPNSRVLEGDLLAFHTACVAIQKRADELLVQVESFRLQRLAGNDPVDEEAAGHALHTGNLESEQIIHLTEALNTASMTDTALGASASSYGSSSAAAVWMEHELGKPPGSSGSEIEQPTSRLNPYSNPRETRNLRPSSGANPSESSPGGTMRKNGKHARKFLSGFIPGRKGRALSPEAVGRVPVEEGPSQGWRNPERERVEEGAKSRDRREERDREEEDREREGGIVKDRNRGLGIGTDNGAGRRKG